VKSLDLIATARDLVEAKMGKPRQSNLRRAVSTAYYAIFHCLAKCCADLLIGGTNADKGTPAWRHVYRALEHGQAVKACKDNNKLKTLPKEIQDFANTFVASQKKRQVADYDPTEKFFKSSVIQDIDDIEEVIKRFTTLPAKHRRAFAAFVLFKNRS
jgi:uncharacterized protein (UPF0332 family)